MGVPPEVKARTEGTAGRIAAGYPPCVVCICTEAARLQVPPQARDRRHEPGRQAVRHAGLDVGGGRRRRLRCHGLPHHEEPAAGVARAARSGKPWCRPHFRRVPLRHCRHEPVHHRPLRERPACPHLHPVPHTRYRRTAHPLLPGQHARLHARCREDARLDAVGRIRVVRLFLRIPAVRQFRHRRSGSDLCPRFRPP